MSSKIILRGTPIEEAPLVIDNARLIPFAPAERDLTDELLDELAYEHPDAAPDEIEDAIQEAMDQLRDAPAVIPEDDDGSGFGDGGQSSEFGVQSSEFGIESPGGELQAPELGFGIEPALSEPQGFGQTQDAELETQNSELLLADARSEAHQVLSEADERAAEIEQAAFQKGYDEGLVAGRAAGEEQAAEMVKQVVAIIDQASELHDRMLADAESEMVALCLEIARKVVQSELRTNPEVVNNVLSAAVKKINGSPRVAIKVNSGQVDAVRLHWDTAFGANYREKEWIIEGDPNVTPGGCVLDTKYGSIDARIGTQFSEIQKTFALLLGTNQ